MSPLKKDKSGFSLSGMALVEVMRQVLAQKSNFSFVARGSSMIPFIREGDTLTITPLTGAYLPLGLPVAFVDPRKGGLIVHRIIRPGRKSCLIKGDSTFLADGLIEKENILGAVSAVERRGRRVYAGLGPERLIISFLNGSNLLAALSLLWNKLPANLRKMIV